MKRINLSLFCWSGLICVAFPAVGQSQFKIIDSVIADGGTTLSKGGAYALSGTMGQPFTEPLRGGNLTLAGGFWGVGVPIQRTNMPLLTIARPGNQIIISWPAETLLPSVQLEERASLGTPTRWTLVAQPPIVNNGENRVIIPVTFATRFYRLTRPGE
ncbi:MAG: hypothetical protein ABI651_12550 [Verrucomicrobiota bacterium]